MMKVFEFIDVVAKFHSYMKHGNTGNADAFAEKLGISRASLFNLINELKDYGIEIEYSREYQTYKYAEPEKVEINVTIRQQG